MRSKKLSILFLALVLSGGVFAGLPQLEEDLEGPTVKAGGGTVAPITVKVTSTDQGASSFSADDSAPCAKVDNSLSLATLKSITKGGKSISVTPGEKVEERNGRNVTIKDYNNLQVYVPSHVQACLNLGVSARKLGNDVILEFHNVHVFKPESAYVGMSGDQKLEKCLSEDVEDKDGTKVTTKVIVENKFIPKVINAPLTRNVAVLKPDNESFDISKDVNIFVAASRVGSTHTSAYNKDLVNPAGASKCFVYEQPATKGMKLVDRAKLLLYKNLQDCDGGPCNAAISAALDELSSQGIGNGNDLFNILTDARERLKDAEVKRIEKKLEEVGKDLAKMTTDNIERDEQAIREKLREYISLLADYEKFPLAPRLEELRQLYDLLDKGQANDEMRQIYTDAKGMVNKEKLQKRIKDLKKLIGEISQTKYAFDGAIKKAEALGLKDDADYLARIRLTSSYYSDRQFVLGSKAESLNPDQAQNKVDSEMKKYSERSREMLEIYESKNGIANHSRRYEREVQKAQAARDSRWQGFMKTEQNYNEACMSAGWFSQGMKNPQKCKRGQMGRQQRYSRAMKARNSDERRISRKYQVASTLSQHEEEYSRKIASEHEDGGDIMDNSTVMDYSDEYTGDSSGMNMFQMNGMGNQQFYNPWGQQQMMNPMMQQQYNMPMR